MNVAIVLSGGTGTRLGGDIPKQYIRVNNKMIIGYCLDTVINHGMIDAVQIVADRDWHEPIMHEINKMNISASVFKGFSLPGKTRQLSIFNGLEDVMKYAGEDDYVIIHDAARPLVSAETIADCLDKAREHDGAMPALPMKDTVYFSEDGRTISSLLKRESIFAGQAPEAFALGAYYRANKSLMPDKILKINGSAEPAVMAGMDIAMTNGDENNFKITTKADLERFCEIIRERKGD
ncbi:MAG: 2-C-methyl-D-erythritol 4-phosphate cytidylyltransferase [Oscillospiraceae bacterium]|nr:2-C-methyl-D-erythritol 4-phosphate cytidylyltransferase [Oscillospiraceae bacterium]